MKIIKEHINFKRGLDPKTAMSTGLPGKWLSLKKGDKLKIKRAFYVNAQNRLDDNSIYVHFYETENQNDLWLIINTPPELYDDGCIGFTAFTGNNRVRSNSDYFLWGTPSEFEERLEIMK